VGTTAGFAGQQNQAVAVGNRAGFTNQQVNAVAVGQNAGSINQQARGVAIGINAAGAGQGASSIWVGASANAGTQAATSIVLTVENVNTFATTAGGCYVRSLQGRAMNTGITPLPPFYPVAYDSVNKELVYSTN